MRSNTQTFAYGGVQCDSTKHDCSSELALVKQTKTKTKNRNRKVNVDWPFEPQSKGLLTSQFIKHHIWLKFVTSAVSS